MAKKRTISEHPAEQVTGIERAVALLQAARECVEACAAQRAARQLHAGTLSQMNRQLGEIVKKLNAYVNG